MITTAVVTSGTKVIDDGPRLACPEQRTRKYHAVKWDVVLGHEVKQLHLVSHIENYTISDANDNTNLNNYQHHNVLTICNRPQSNNEL